MTYEQSNPLLLSSGSSISIASDRYLDDQEDSADFNRHGNSPLWKVVGVSSCWIGIQILWAVELGLTTPYFTKILNVSPQMAMMVWMAGPLTGIFVSPFIGALSDRCTSRFGKRRPFMFIGLVLTVFLSTLYSCAAEIAGRGNLTAQLLAFLAFWGMDIALMMVMGPLRALVSDMCSKDRQSLAQTLCSMFQGIGSVAGFLIIPFFGHDALGKIHYVFCVGNMSLIVFTLIGIFLGEEMPMPPRKLDYLAREGGVWTMAMKSFKQTKEALISMEGPLIRIAVAQSFTWLAWYCFTPIYTSWFGNIVYGARYVRNPEQHKKVFHEGVSDGASSLVGMAFVQFLFSLIVPPLVGEYGIVKAYTISLFTLPLCLLGSSVPSITVVPAKLLTALSGISYGATQIFPYALIGIISEKNEVCTNMGLINIFISVPQILDTLYVGHIVNAYSESAALLIGGIWGVAAVIAAANCVVSPVSRKIKEQYQMANLHMDFKDQYMEVPVEEEEYFHAAGST
eukprot:Nk52_evm5s357 gene=Nk52_evmTU5s357